MPLSSGTKLGHYEVVESIGAGGMGEVYRARDTKLGRDVAVKVLPEEFARDQERLDRFEREARLLAQLNHPNIAALHGLEEHNGQKFLVMELVEGETLAEKIAQGPLPIDEAIPLFVQIAEGLEAAHEKGIIHRDLKPANVKVGPDGKPKILDFGLAKAFVGDTEVASASSQSPTLTKGTALGAIMGTASYMSPEQARGKPVDKRTDVWAFGCCLYESLSSKKAFPGETVSDVIGAVMRAEPGWEVLPKAVPRSIHLLLKKCLTKDRRHRLHDIADARLDLENSDSPDVAEPIRTSSSRFLWTGAGLIVGLATAFILRGRASDVVDRGPSSAMHLRIAPPEGITLRYSPDGTSGLDISPDGTRLAFLGSDGVDRLYLQDLDTGETRSVMANATNPFFSHDGRWLGFVANRRLFKVATSAGEPVELSELQGLFRGGDFSPDGKWVYFTPALATGVWRVPSDGGVAEQVTTPKSDGFDNTHYWPVVLPDGRFLSFTSCCGRNRVALYDLETSETTYLVEDAFSAQFLESGHVLFAQSNSLFAARFDLGSLRLGESVKIVEDIVVGGDFAAEYTVSKNGLLAFLSGTSTFTQTLVEFDRGGNLDVMVPGQRPYWLATSPAPDGRRLALTLYQGNQDVYVYDIARGDFDRFTDDPHNDFWPSWTPDGRNIVFTSVRSGNLDLYIKSSDNSAPEKLLLASDVPKWAGNWTPDGQTLVFEQEHPETGSDVWTYSMESGEAHPFLTGPFNEEAPFLSPDGAWLAYDSDELGRSEVYVVPFPGPGARCKVSTNGGWEPKWSRDGAELFYRQESTAMVVDVRQRNFCDAKPQRLFEGLSEMAWNVLPSGEFVGVAPPKTPRLNLIVNWLEKLERRAPTHN